MGLSLLECNIFASEIALKRIREFIAWWEGVRIPESKFKAKVQSDVQIVEANLELLHVSRVVAVQPPHGKAELTSLAAPSNLTQPNLISY